MPPCPKLTLRGKGVLGTDHLVNVGGGGGCLATSSEHYLQEQQHYLQDFFPPK